MNDILFADTSINS